MKNPMPGWIKQNFRIKMGLFLLATLLWFLVVSKRSYEYAIVIPIEVIGLQPDMTLVNSLPSEALVKFRAAGQSLLSIRFITHPSLRLDVSSVNDSLSIPCEPAMVILPGGVNAIVLEIIQPDTIDVKVDKMWRLTLPVIPEINIQPAAGYTVVGNVKVTPPSIQIHGPYSRIRNYSEVLTVPVSLTKLSRNIDITVDLKKFEGFGVKMNPESVTIQVKVERLGERSIIGVPLKTINTPRRREIILEPGSVDIKVSGAISVLTSLLPEDLNVWVNYREFNPNRGGYVPVHVDSDAPIEFEHITPDTVKLIVMLK